MHPCRPLPMSMMMRVTGAWTQLLTDWLDRENLAARGVRAMLATYAPDDVVPMPVWKDALNQAAALRPQLPAHGLLMGAGVETRHVGVLGYLALSSDNLGESLNTYLRYERLFYGVDLAEVVAIGTDIEVRWPPVPQGTLANETSIAALVAFMRKQVDTHANPSRIGFVHAALPERAQACEAFFGCPVDFERPYTSVRIPQTYLAIPMLHREPGLRALLDRQAQALLDALPDPNAFDRAVQRLLVSMLPEGEVSLDKVAHAMHQSARTLQRRLTDSGMTWQQLLDRTREQLARQYLADPTLSLAEIALLLGYSEQSAFTRAFRRWSGHTPMGFRQQAEKGT